MTATVDPLLTLVERAEVMAMPVRDVLRMARDAINVLDAACHYEANPDLEMAANLIERLTSIVDGSVTTEKEQVL